MIEHNSDAMMDVRIRTTLVELGSAVVRPAAGIAYSAERMSETRAAAGQELVDRITAELDPRGVLAA